MKEDGMSSVFAKLAEALEKTKNTVVDDKIQYPIQVDVLKRYEVKAEEHRESVGKWVKIRPCADKYENKTFVGIHLGDMPVGSMVAYNPDVKELSMIMKRNPAIFVPDLGKIIYGMESWWGEIQSEADLKDITDQDISNVWYVKALKSLSR